MVNIVIWLIQHGMSHSVDVLRKVYKSKSICGTLILKTKSYKSQYLHFIL